MKKFLLAAGVVALAACSNEPSGPATISATIENLADGKVIARVIGDNKLESIDSVEATGGSFSFTFDSLQPQIVVFEFTSGEPSIGFYFDGHSAEITGKADSLPMFKSTGSVLQDSLAVFNTFNRNTQMAYQELNQRYMQAMQANDAMGMAAVQEEGSRLDSINQAYAKAFARRNTLVGAYLVNNYIYEPDLELLKAIKDQIPVANASAPDVKRLVERIEVMEKTAIGSPFIDFTLSDTTGAPVTLASQAMKGYLLIDFWASWCQPCRVTNPTLVGIYNDFSAKGFTILGVSLDDDGLNWREAIKADQLAWNHVSDLQGWQNEAAKLYGVRFIPQSVLLDPNGRIVLKNPNMDELRSFLAANLANM